MLKWFCCVGQEREQPETGDYSDWKETIAKLCGQRCIYCCIPVARFGGIDNFHVEHFRPKSKFDELRRTISNLFLACAICNRFKSNCWPADPADDHSLIAFPDPIRTDYNELFDFEGLEVRGRFIATRYVVEQLYLNRPQLLRERRIANAEERVNATFERVRQLLESIQNGPHSAEIQRDALYCSMKMTECERMLRTALTSQPYDLREIRRPRS